MWATLGLVFLVTLGTRLGWESYPRFLDSYYHLAVIQGFHQASGVALHAFWEAAPVGRPHLYPPLFHLVWAPVWWLTRDPVTVARLWSMLGAPLLLLAAVWATRLLGGTRRACLTTVALLIPAPIYLSTLLHPTATLAVIEILVLWVLLERRQVASGGIVLGLIGTTHPGLPWVTLLALNVLGLADRRHRHALAIAGVGSLIMAPWWLHVAGNTHAFQWIQQPESRSLEISPVIWGLGIVGGILGVQKHPAYRFPIALLAAALPGAFLYPYRVLAQGLVPLALLGGLALERTWNWVGVWKPRYRVILFGALLTLSPTISLDLSPSSIRHSSIVSLQSHDLSRSSIPHSAFRVPHCHWADTGFLAALRGVPIGRGHLESLYDAPHFAPLVRVIRESAQPDDLLFCNFSYMGGLLSALTGLSTTTSMVVEAGRRPWREALDDARWIVWFKMPADLDPESDATALELARERAWRLALETPIAWVYEAQGSHARRKITGPVIPWGVAYAALIAMLMLQKAAISRKR